MTLKEIVLAKGVKKEPYDKNINTIDMVRGSAYVTIFEEILKNIKEKEEKDEIIQAIANHFDSDSKSMLIDFLNKDDKSFFNYIKERYNIDDREALKEGSILQKTLEHWCLKFDSFASFSPAQHGNTTIFDLSKIVASKIDSSLMNNEKNKRSYFVFNTNDEEIVGNFNIYQKFALSKKEDNVIPAKCNIEFFDKKGEKIPFSIYKVDKNGNQTFLEKYTKSYTADEKLDGYMYRLAAEPIKMEIKNQNGDILYGGTEGSAISDLNQEIFNKGGISVDYGDYVRGQAFIKAIMNRNAMLVPHPVKKSNLYEGFSFSGIGVDDFGNNIIKNIAKYSNITLGDLLKVLPTLSTMGIDVPITDRSKKNLEAFFNNAKNASLNTSGKMQLPNIVVDQKQLFKIPTENENNRLTTKNNALPIEMAMSGDTNFNLEEALKDISNSNKNSDKFEFRTKDRVFVKVSSDTLETLDKEYCKDGIYALNPKSSKITAKSVSDLFLAMFAKINNMSPFVKDVNKLNSYKKEIYDFFLSNTADLDVIFSDNPENEPFSEKKINKLNIFLENVSKKINNLETKISFKIKDSDLNKSFEINNSEQADIIYQVAKAASGITPDNRFNVLVGPPGIGKTYTASLLSSLFGGFIKGSENPDALLAFKGESDGVSMAPDDRFKELASIYYRKVTGHDDSLFLLDEVIPDLVKILNGNSIHEPAKLLSVLNYLTGMGGVSSLTNPSYQGGVPVTGLVNIGTGNFFNINLNTDQLAYLQPILDRLNVTFAYGKGQMNEPDKLMPIIKGNLMRGKSEFYSVFDDKLFLESVIMDENYKQKGITEKLREEIVNHLSNIEPISLYKGDDFTKYLEEVEKWMPVLKEKANWQEFDLTFYSNPSNIDCDYIKDNIKKIADGVAYINENVIKYSNEELTERAKTKNMPLDVSSYNTLINSIKETDAEQSCINFRKIKDMVNDLLYKGKSVTSDSLLSALYSCNESLYKTLEDDDKISDIKRQLDIILSGTIKYNDVVSNNNEKIGNELSDMI